MTNPRPFLSAANANRPSKPLLINAKPGFDWSTVKWTGPRQRLGEACSVCDTPIDEDSVPLIIWRDDASAAQFCDGCARRWFGLETFPEEPDA